MIRTETPRTLPRVGAGQKPIRPVSASSRRRGKSDPVEVQEKRFGYFPQRFRWRGHSYHVQAVERCTTRMVRSAQLCFRVRCNEGTFDLAQEVKTNVWKLSVVRMSGS